MCFWASNNHQPAWTTEDCRRKGIFSMGLSTSEDLRDPSKMGFHRTWGKSLQKGVFIHQKIRKKKWCVFGRKKSGQNIGMSQRGSPWIVASTSMELSNAGLGGKGLLSRYTANCSIKVLTKVQLSILGSVATNVARENIWHKWHNVRLSHKIDACIIIYLCTLYTSLSVNLWYVVALTSTRSNHEAEAQMIPTPSNPSNLSHA